jgi:nitroreductase
MLTHNALLSRVSTPTRQLAAPGPSEAQLLTMLQTAVHVPDHGKRVPFRFLRITGDARTQLADAVQARLLQLEPDAGAAVIEKLRSRFTVPPITIAVIAQLGEDEKIPASERFSSAACVCFQLLLAAHAEGFGAQWLTGWPAYDRPLLEQTLGLTAGEQLVGTVAIGTSMVAVPERERPDAADLLSDWTASSTHRFDHS